MNDSPIRRWRVAGINFDHMHMGDLLRLVHEHPNADIVGICDANPQRMQAAVDAFGLSTERVYTDVERCLRETQPDVVMLCPTTADHATYVERVAPFGVHILIEKPFAASLQDADRMISAVQSSGKTLVINWPLAWYPPHVTTKRLIIDNGLS